jgi:hypothetical protein
MVGGPTRTSLGRPCGNCDEGPAERLRVMRVQRLRSRFEVFGKKNSPKKFGRRGNFALAIATRFFAIFPEKGNRATGEDAAPPDGPSSMIARAFPPRATGRDLRWSSAEDQFVIVRVDGEFSHLVEDRERQKIEGFPLPDACGHIRERVPSDAHAAYDHPALAHRSAVRDGGGSIVGPEGLA